MKADRATDRPLRSVAVGPQRDDDPAGRAVIFDALEHSVYEPALLTGSERIDVIRIEDGLQLMQHALLDLGRRKRGTGTAGATTRLGVAADIVAPAP